MTKSKTNIILTFDDGPHPVWTNTIIDLLDRYDVKALFFLVGKKIAQYPALVNKLITRGHVIGNHTWSHKPLVMLNDKRLHAEIYSCHQYLLDKFNYQVHYFRPPWGLISARQREVINSQFGYKIIFWNKDSYDYLWPYSRNLYDTITRAKKDPCILLFHDGIILSPLFTRKHMVATLKKLLPLKDSKIDFVLPMESE